MRCLQSSTAGRNCNERKFQIVQTASSPPPWPATIATYLETDKRHDISRQDLRPLHGVVYSVCPSFLGPVSPLAVPVAVCRKPVGMLIYHSLLFSLRPSACLATRAFVRAPSWRCVSIDFAHAINGPYIPAGLRAPHTHERSCPTGHYMSGLCAPRLRRGLQGHCQIHS